MNVLKSIIRGFVGIRKFVNWIRPSKRIPHTTERAGSNAKPLTKLCDAYIVNRNRIENRLKTQTACSKRVTDNHIVHYKRIELTFGTNQAKLRVHKEGSRSGGGWLGSKEFIIKSSFLNLTSKLELPGLQLDKLTFRVWHSSKEGWQVEMDEASQFLMDNLKEFLSCLPHQISVKHLTVDHKSIDVLHRLLPHFKAGRLESIHLLDLGSKKNFAGKLKLFREISQMEQWQQARTISFECETNYYYEGIEKVDELPSEDDFQFIKTVIAVMNPNQTFHLFAAQFLGVYWRRLEEEATLSVSYVRPRSETVRYRKDYIQIEKK